MTLTLRVPRPDLLSSRPAVVLAVLGLLAVGLQIAWPLASAAGRERLSIAVVVVLAAFCVAHAGLLLGPAWAAAMLAITAGPGFAAEVVGVRTGVPFGSYAYSEVIGPRLAGVPLVVGLAWTMLCWPAALTARRLASRPVARLAVAAWATTALDLFLDPQLVALGAWTWHHPDPHLPGVPDVPLTNYAGWLLVTVLLQAALLALLARPDARRPGPRGMITDVPGLVLYLWFCVSWVVALAVFLGQPAAAGWGALAAGVVAVPLVVRLRRSGTVGPWA